MNKYFQEFDKFEKLLKLLLAEKTPDGRRKYTIEEILRIMNLPTDRTTWCHRLSDWGLAHGIRRRGFSRRHKKAEGDLFEQASADLIKNKVVEGIITTYKTIKPLADYYGIDLSQIDC